MFIGGEGGDIGGGFGRYKTFFCGKGADQLWGFGERAYIAGDEGGLLLLDFLCIYRESLPDPAKMTES
jgi:hypothetical protein